MIKGGLIFDEAKNSLHSVYQLHLPFSFTDGSELRILVIGEGTRNALAFLEQV